MAWRDTDSARLAAHDASRIRRGIYSARARAALTDPGAFARIWPELDRELYLAGLEDEGITDAATIPRKTRRGTIQRR